MPKLVFISDTHNQLHKVNVPEGDVLVHCGDATNMGRVEELTRFFADFSALPHRRKVLIAGNHDWLFEKDPGLARSLVPVGVDYLQDSGVEIDGLKFWGSPYQPEFCNWAFNLSRYEGQLTEKWAMIPDGTDVLVTHGPPKGVLDNAYDHHVGCADLLHRVLPLRPKIHAFGHIHYDYGEKMFNGTHFVNASCCNERYMPVNAPIVVEL
jgi:Icc-related predicted phosphoesterase